MFAGTPTLHRQTQASCYLADSAVASALLEGWGIATDEIEYAKLGFGSHHWRASANGVRWFLTVDNLDARQRGATETRADALERLTIALDVCRLLHDVGLSFVVAPVPTQPRHGRFSGGMRCPCEPRSPPTMTSSRSFGHNGIEW